ncbi:MAG TPA: type II secretion system protein, partial [Oceanipulchritudo sp.]|nr:type II secretion system protein [Oceanipulchritudo sp.]
MCQSHRAPKAGFTLIEVIAALILIGISAAILIPITGTGLRAELGFAGRNEQAEAIRGQMDAWLHSHRSGEGNDMIQFRQLVEATQLPAGVSIRDLQ